MELSNASHAGEPHKLSILVFGVGGCGVQVLKSMAGAWTEHFKGYALDTDPQMQGESSGVEFIHLTSRATQGMSCGGDATAGRHALNESRAELTELCSMADLIFIAAGFGGGTGTGGANALAEIASEAGALVIGFVAMPFEFEGAVRGAAAREGLTAFRDLVDGVVVVENQRLLSRADGEIGVQAAFDVIAEAVSQNIMAMQRLLASPGVVNIDFADVRRMVMNSHGRCTMVCAAASGKGRAERVLQEVLDHPLFCSRTVLAAAQSVIVGICGGNNLTLREMETIMSGLSGILSGTAAIKMGTTLNPSEKEGITLMVLASETEEAAGDEPEAAEQDAQVLHRTGTGPESGKKKGKAVQSRLNLDAPGKGRFKDVEPTLRNGEDLDIPTFMRRGIRLRPPSNEPR